MRGLTANLPKIRIIADIGTGSAAPGWPGRDEVAKRCWVRGRKEKGSPAAAARTGTVEADATAETMDA
jgi:hypothetical protein